MRRAWRWLAAPRLSLVDLMVSAFVLGVVKAVFGWA